MAFKVSTKGMVEGNCIIDKPFVKNDGTLQLFAVSEFRSVEVPVVLTALACQNCCETFSPPGHFISQPLVKTHNENCQDPPHSSSPTYTIQFIQLGKALIMPSNPQSVNGSESEFEFIETPKAPTPTFEKFEECGVKTTSVSIFQTLALLHASSLHSGFSPMHQLNFH